MIKKVSVISVIIALMSLAPVSAGNGLKLVDFGVKGGITTQKAKFSRSGKHSVYDLSTSSNVGYHLGMISRFNLPLFHIQAEMLYNHTGYDITAIDRTSNGSWTKSKVKINTVELPVLAGLRLLWFRLQAGPQFNLVTETKFSNRGNVNDVEFTKSTMSFLFGLGFDIGRINLDVRYNGQFKRAEQSVQFLNEVTGVNYKSRTGSWTFSMGYTF